MSSWNNKVVVITGGTTGIGRSTAKQFADAAPKVIGLPGASAYAATKAALRSIVRTAASEWAERKIRVNAVAPGPIETPIYGKLGMPGEAVSGFKESMTAQVPLGRFGQPDEIAAPVLFLASEAASFINGVELPVDGGFTQV